MLFGVRRCRLHFLRDSARVFYMVIFVGEEFAVNLERKKEEKKREERGSWMTCEVMHIYVI